MQLSLELTEKEMRAEIRRLNKNIKRRMSNIEKSISSQKQNVATSLLSSGVRAYSKAAPLLEKGLRKLNAKEVKSLYRQLKYTEGLKTSNAKYVNKALRDINKKRNQAKSSKEEIIKEKEPIEVVTKLIESYEKWGKKNKAKYNELMNRLQETNPYIFERYKYRIQEEIINKINSRMNIDKAYDQLMETMDKLYYEEIESSPFYGKWEI